MLPQQWEIFKRAARLEKLDQIPMALIIDSPWMPGYLGIKHLDYFLDPELWFQSNLKIMREFPDIDVSSPFGTALSERKQPPPSPRASGRVLNLS